MVTFGAFYFSGVGVAVAVSAFYMAFAPVYSYKVFRKVGISLNEIAQIYLPPVSFATVAALVAVVCEQWMPSGSELPRILVIGLVGGMLYLALVHLFAPSIFHQLLARLRESNLVRASRPALTGET
jgi:hypothetical protein